ncbi:hypothetical protein LPJ78_004386 [Coemansia sp. RSA 989]|nr:hypothetical protein BX667DRAFT_506830 [Coemansia mojavensis]KAJ1748847.1 hypothetical protein LPJ79_004210 [Coemansia sp. RSA 1821]KAJ1862937.1 hypothetical protein LPJ78_004386 [Coemansia sp. RSA 989]KAJ1870783.1 hypothetical protein LPJ55_004405 [Coemansia sp. RSA 990]KAJ2670169.1 hypothetical protein IWW42_004127 [Coemansia sp. RSA 1085]
MYTLTAATCLLYFQTATLLGYVGKTRLAWASPVPQTTAWESSSLSQEVAPTSQTDNNGFDGSNVGMGSKQIYYILAIGACAIGVFAFIVMYMYRKRRSRFMLANRQHAEAEDDAQEHQAHERHRKKHIVLSAKQFAMLPHFTAQETVPTNDVMKESTDNTESATTNHTAFHNQAESCSICLCDIMAGEQLVSLVPCSHQFHVDCASQWLTQKSTLCPLCKADMLEGLGLVKSKLVDDENEDIELVTVPASPRNVPEEPARPEHNVPAEALSMPEPPPPAATVERRRSAIR